MLDDTELFAERLSTSVSGLLTLVGIDADPVRSREHILLSTILGAAWKQGEDLDLGALIARIQNPPVTQSACSTSSPSTRRRTASSWPCA